jgi:hypothetical protein
MKLKRDIPIYVLSGSLVFLGVSISSNQAVADPSQVSASEFKRLKTDYDSFKRCVISNLNEMMFFDADRNSRMFIRSCR